MEKVHNELEHVTQKIQLIEEYIALSLRREKIAPNLWQLTNEMQTVEQSLTEAQKILKDELKTMEHQYSVLMNEIKLKQCTLQKFILEERQRKCNEARKAQISDTTNRLGEQVPMTPASNKSKQFTVPCHTPKISIPEYKASPFVNRKILPKPSIIFSEFEATITSNQFDNLPKYMRGRQSLSELQEFLENTIIPCFNEKYQLLYRKRSALRQHSEMELWKLYHDQVDYVPGRHFITPGDISRRLNKMYDRKVQNRLIMLRHLGILEETKVQQTTCYIWAVK